MQYRHRQLGITFWGMMFVIGVMSCVLFILFKLFPPYMEDLKVKTALDSLMRQPDVSSMTRPEILNALDKRFDIDNVTDVDLNKSLIVESRGRRKIIAIRYENIVPVVGNISALLEFDHTKEVGTSE
jgi:hypothetical protein